MYKVKTVEYYPSNKNKQAFPVRVLSRTINPKRDLSTGQVLMIESIINNFSPRDIPTLGGMLSGFRTG